MGLKEVFQNVDKKHAAVVSLLAVVAVSTVVNTVGTFQVKNLIANGGEVAAPAARPAAKGPTKKPSEYKFGKDYNKAIKEKKPMMLLFYADWCHYCVNFMPIYEKLYKQYKNKYNFVKINVEDEKYEQQVRDYQINAFPTLFLVNPQDEDAHEHVENSNFGDSAKMKEILDEFYEENSGK